MEQTIRINPFNLNSLCKNPTILLCAKRGSGKSVLIKHLIHYFNSVLHYPAGVLCSASEDSDPYYKYFFPDCYIYSECNDKLFSKIINRQKMLKLKNKKNLADGKPLIDSRLLVILDDVIANAKDWKNSQDYKDIMFNGRHYDITLILAVQDVVAVGPDARNNFDYIFLFANDIKNEIDKTYKYYAGIFPKVSIFTEVLHAVTEDYGTLVLIKRDAKSNQLEDKIARFKANINIKPTMFGCHKFRELHRKRYDENWEEKEIMGNNNGYKSNIKILK